MTNEDDPLLYDDDIEDEAGSNSQVSLADVWNNNPALKLFAIIAIMAIGIIAFLFLGGSNEKPDISRVSSANSVSQTPGQDALTPAYEEAIETADQQRLEEALNTGSSAMPTPISRPVPRIEAPQVVEEEDPLEKWRREAERRREERNREKPPTLPTPPSEENQQPSNLPQLPVPQVNQRQQMLQQLPTGPTPEQVQNLSNIFRQQMTLILESQIPQSSVLVNQGISKPYVVESDENSELTDNFNGNMNSDLVDLASEDALSTEVEQEMLIPAGEIEYGQIITQANSDIPGPVLAEIASGPLSGARVIGNFTLKDKYLVLTFSKAVVNRKEYAINAIAVDPATTLTGVATDVNNHYFTRVFLPGAAKFIEGWAEAAVKQGTSVTVNGETVATTQDELNTGDELLAGFEETAGEIADILDDQDDRQITVKVAPGTRVGLLFLDSLYQDVTEEQ